MRDVSYLGRDVGVHASPLHDVHDLPHGPGKALPLALRIVSQGRRALGLHASRALSELRHVPQAARGTLGVRVHEVPQSRHHLGLLPPQIHELRLVSPATCQPLRQFVRIVSLDLRPLVERHVPTPGDPRWRTHLPQFRLHELPPERVLLGNLHEVSRFEWA